MILRLRDQLGRFGRDEGGSVSIEFVIIVPILLWAHIMTFVFTDVFRARSLEIKSNATLADILSRENASVDTAYMQTMHLLMQRISRVSAADSYIRVSTVRKVTANDPPQLVWSRTQGGGSPLTAATVGSILPAVPTMALGETLIVVESWRTYRPAFAAGIAVQTFRSISPVRPRFAARLCWNQSGTLTC